MNLPKTTPVRPPSAEDRSRLAQIAALVDKLGPLERDTAPWLIKIREAETLRRQLRDLYDASPAGQLFEARGEKFVALVGPKAQKRIIDYPMLWKLAGVSLMKKIATVSISAVEESFGKDVTARIVSSEAGGFRSLKVFARASEQDKAA